MKVLIVAALVALGGSSAAATGPVPANAVPRPTTVSLDAFSLSPTVQYGGSFWCEYNDYGAYFSNYVGQCPYQDFVATLHWKKVPHVTEYDVCVQPTFASYGPGYACQVVKPSSAGDPASLSYTFDSARDALNSTQGTTQEFVVQACRLDANGVGTCSDSNTVSALIPWTG